MLLNVHVFSADTKHDTKHYNLSELVMIKINVNTALVYSLKVLTYQVNSLTSIPHEPIVVVHKA